MVLFLIFLIPLCLSVILINYHRDGDGILLPLLPFFWGMLLFLPGLLLHTIITGFFEPSYTGVGFYFHAFLKEHFLFFGIACGWAGLLRKYLLVPVKRDTLYKALAFFGGYYSVLNIFQYLSRITHLDFYALFLLPVLNLAALFLGVLLLIQFLSFYGLARYLSLAGLIAVPFALTLATVLYQRNEPALAVIAAIVIAGLAGVSFFLQKDKIY